MNKKKHVYHNQSKQFVQDSINNSFRLLLFIALLSIIFFSIDVAQFFLLGKIVAPLLTCMYCSLLFAELHWGTLSSIVLLQCLEYFCFYTYFFLPLIYLVPVTGLALYFKKNFYSTIFHVITLTLICSIIENYLIQGYLLAIVPQNNYTIMKISAMLIITIVFSLTINRWGMQDNRL